MHPAATREDGFSCDASLYGAEPEDAAIGSKTTTANDSARIFKSS